MAMDGSIGRVSALTQSDAIHKEKVESTFTEYSKLFDENKGGSVEVRKTNYTTMVNDFYNMVTDIYEFGWGESFHFAPRHKWESFAASIARQEMYIAHLGGLQPGMTALDLGCGVGGPGRTVARFSGANVVGLNNNDYQIQRCKALTKKQGLSHLCSYMKADWMNIPVEDNTYDVAFHFEALEHSPDRVAACTEIKRVIKPGGYFVGQDWIITDKCDVNNPVHKSIKKGIELGNGLPDLEKPDTVIDSLKKAGFEVVMVKDMALYNTDYEIGWYDSLEGKYWSMESFKHTPLGMWLTSKFVWSLETCRLAPKGTLAIHSMLTKVAGELVAGGQLGIFSPLFVYVCRKPL